MGKNRFVIADTHFGHANMLNFKRKDGRPVRPFSSAEEMDETMIQNWNSVVNDSDYVYHLGDVCFDVKKYLLEIRPRLKGKLRLIIGNHDERNLTNPDFMRSFEKVRFWYSIKEHDIIASHIPLMPSQFKGKCKRNVHGHIHEKHVREYGDFPQLPLWACVSVEHINYTPVNVDDLDRLFVL
jgi:calcineurin-like phosphoesterase family protein